MNHATGVLKNCISPPIPLLPSGYPLPYGVALFFWLIQLDTSVRRVITCLDRNLLKHMLSRQEKCHSYEGARGIQYKHALSAMRHDVEVSAPFSGSSSQPSSSSIFLGNVRNFSHRLFQGLFFPKSIKQLRMNVVVGMRKRLRRFHRPTPSRRRCCCLQGGCSEM